LGALFPGQINFSLPLEVILQTNDKINFTLKRSENSEILCVNLFRINNEMKIAAVDVISQLARGYTLFLTPSLVL